MTLEKKHTKIAIMALVAVAAISIPSVYAIAQESLEDFCDPLPTATVKAKYWVCHDLDPRITALESITIVNGTNGVDGTNGLDGQDGIQGPIGLIGPQGIAGTNGIDGVNGIQGNQGIQGETGLTGSQGPSGSLTTSNFYTINVVTPYSPSSTIQLYVFCNPGDVLLSGGYYMDTALQNAIGDKFHIIASDMGGPNSSGYKDRYHLDLHSVDSTPISGSIGVRAHCLDLNP